jgi:uncharacterized ion transporter superfamily protein YfcC
MEEKKKAPKQRLSAYSLILIILVVVAFIAWLISLQSGSGVTAPKFSDIFMAPVNGFVDAREVCIFVIILGGFLGIVTSTGAIETGIAALIKKLKGHELWIIPILMFLFSIGGTTYGMQEETVGFYILLAATMYAAGYDSLTGVAIVLLGAGVGVLGSTINPFAVGAAVAALPAGVAADQSVLIGLGAILWISSYLIATAYVMKYAAKVKKEKGSTFLSLQEQEAEKKAYANKDLDENNKLSKKQKWVLILFLLTFVYMIISFIPWVNFGVISQEVADAGTHWSAWLTGNCLGYYYFLDAATWFLLMAIVIGVVAGIKEQDWVNTFIKGAGDIIGVVLVIALSRGIRVIMDKTGLGNYIISNSVNALKGTPAYVFAPCDYILHLVLSVLVPSSSGLATISTPIVAPVAAGIGLNPSVTIMIYVAANGLINLITPTCGTIMGGLALAKVDYSTWFKFSIKLVVILGLVSMAILTVAMMVL